MANHRYLGTELRGGLNQRARWILRALDGALGAVEDRDCASLVIAGDLFDVAKPSPALIASVMDVLASHRGTMAIDFLLGNHDMESGDEHALMPFTNMPSPVRTPASSVYTQPTVIQRRGAETGTSSVLMAPFCTGPASDWLRIALSHETLPKSGGALLVTHVGLIDKDTPPFLRGADDAIETDLLDELCADAGIPCVIAGNWHKHKVIRGKRGTLMVQAGALVPTGYDNPGTEGYGTVCIYDHELDRVDVLEIPGPRFIKVDRLTDIPRDVPEGMTYAVRVCTEADPGESDHPRIHLEWAPPSAVQPANHDQARATAQTAGSIAEAVAAYCDAVVLDKDVSREDVKRKCWGYL